MTDLKQAAQQALEFLEGGSFVYPTQLATALREALAQPVQPVQEPVGEVVEVNNDGFQCEFNRRLAVGTKLYIAPPLPVQEPVACRFCHSKKGCWTWQCYHCGEIDDVQKPISPAAQPEPLEYWNAVEGWVKIDEVREHFEAVNCGTIYKHGGEGRVPLYTAPPQRPWVGLTEDEKPEPHPFVVKHYIYEDRPTIKGNGFDGLEIGVDRKDAEVFIEWVNAHIFTLPAAQREWQGLTTEEIMEIIGVKSSDSDWNVIKVQEWLRKAEAKLKEKNT